MNGSLRPGYTLPATAGILCALLWIAVPAQSLERTEVRADRRGPEGWSAGSSCTITYANTCTGWLYVWVGEEDDVMGVVFEPCCANGQLVSTQAYFWTGAPQGWGYTGTIAISEVAGDCLGTVYEARPCLPPAGDIVARVDIWEDVPPGAAALTYTFGPTYWLLEMTPTIASDHPAAGPTGPQACGFCFPSTRVGHFFSFGTATSPLCPGERMNDGVCDAEALFWSAGFQCSAVSLTESSWGAVKGLYR